MGNLWRRIRAELTAPRVRDERGDVPGWVMITLMTATLVGVIWGLSDTALRDLLGQAWDSVSPVTARRRDARGSAVVDFVFVVLVLLPLFFGILQLALVLHVRNTLVSAASEGARYGATADRGPADAVARTRQQIREAISGRYAEGVSAHVTVIDGAPAVEVRVEASVPALGILGPAVHLSVTGHAVEEQPVRGPARERGERGSALVELTWLGILLIVPVIWIVLSVFEVQRGAFGVSGAARAAGRAFALAPDDASGRARAEAAARLALADQGFTGPLQVTVTCTPYPADCHSGTSVITVVVRSRADVPLLPDVLGGGAPSFRLQASHTVPIGQYVEITGGRP